MTGANHVDHVVVKFPDQVIEMGVHQDQAGACSPVACIDRELGTILPCIGGCINPPRRRGLTSSNLSSRFKSTLSSMNIIAGHPEKIYLVSFVLAIRFHGVTNQQQYSKPLDGI